MQTLIHSFVFFLDSRRTPLSISTSSNTPRSPASVTTLKPLLTIDKIEDDIDPENSVALNLIRIKNPTNIIQCSKNQNRIELNGTNNTSIRSNSNNNNNNHNTSNKSIKTKIESPSSSLFRPKPESDLLLLDECKKFNNNNRIGTPPSPLNNQSSSYCENDENNDECKSSLKLNKLGKFFLYS